MKSPKKTITLLLVLVLFPIITLYLFHNEPREVVVHVDNLVVSGTFNHAEYGFTANYDASNQIIDILRKEFNSIFFRINKNEAIVSDYGKLLFNVNRNNYDQVSCWEVISRGNNKLMVLMTVIPPSTSKIGVFVYEISLTKDCDKDFISAFRDHFVDKSHVSR